jgi:hypothetical protein
MTHRGVVMHVMFALSKSPNPLARHVTHDVHVTSPFLIQKWFANNVPLI